MLLLNYYASNYAGMTGMYKPTKYSITTNCNSTEISSKSYV